MVDRAPQLHGVQSELCPPFSNQFEFADSFNPDVKSIAEGIAISHPVRTRQVMDAIRATSGAVHVASEKEIERGMDELARKGLYVEPTAAVVWSAASEILATNSNVLAILTGHGLKSPRMM